MKQINSKDNENRTNESGSISENFGHPYMGNLTSHEIGMMAKSGALDNEMFKRMISNIQQDTEDGPTLP
ncbi:hypothetical protein [Vallitalea sp.]|jgi:hypothetical protein|uniref:hypothetical protein n=1 Tax=Vallitalea sp. TaxID=1882829 RepID=UPI0025CBD78E|nr:hypothetical protein [Vallitalea sp.]MCT4687789.1 hypothetical protein [Vallitalea sp.]